MTESERNVINFKLRILELLEIFIKKQPQNRLILNLFVPLARLHWHSAHNTKSKALFDRSTNLIRNKLTRLREYPVLTSFDLSDLYTITSEITSIARKSPSALVCNTLGAMLAFLAKLLIMAGATCEDATLQVYGSLIEEYMTQKNTKLHSSLFGELVDRYPQYSGTLIVKLLSRTCTADVVNGFRQVQAYDLLFTLLKKVSEKSDMKDVFQLYLPSIASSVVQTIQLIATDSEKIKGLSVKRLRSMFKTTLLAIQKSALFYSIPEMEVIWSSNTLTNHMQKIAEHSKFKSSVLKTFTEQILFSRPTKVSKRKNETVEPTIVMDDQNRKRVCKSHASSPSIIVQ
jgi:DNA polymerase phi